MLEKFLRWLKRLFKKKKLEEGEPLILPQRGELGKLSQGEGKLADCCWTPQELELIRNNELVKSEDLIKKLMHVPGCDQCWSLFSYAAPRELLQWLSGRNQK